MIHEPQTDRFMNRTFLFSFFFLLAAAAGAQTEYHVAQATGNDLNAGTMSGRYGRKNNALSYPLFR